MKLRNLINKAAIRILTPFCRSVCEPDKILIIIFSGRFYNGNLKSLYEEFKRRQTFNGKPFKVYWAIRRKKDLNGFRREKVDVLWYYSLFQIPKFLKAGVWLNDHQAAKNIPVARQPGSLWVQAGHAISFRGYAGDDGVRQGLEKFDLNLVSSPWFRDYYVKGVGINPEKVAATGYPRTDRLLKPYYNRERVVGELGFRPDRPIIMYAPTWEQENRGGESLFPFGDDRKLLKELEEFLEKNRMQTLIRLPQKWKGWVPKPNLARRRFGRQGRLALHCARTEWDAEKYLSVTDVLVTDWSSIANDFLVLDRPIIFLDKPPKFFHYGYAILPEERPGTVVKTSQEFFNALIEAVSDPKEYAEKRRILREKVHCELDGQASSRAIAEMEKKFKG
ncbi:MAG: CDP-glycerol glycerophosphotransferase family protein [Candidatus Omnitrophota bacterium]